MRLAAAVPHLPALLVTLTCDPAGISGSQSRIELSSLGQALCLVEPHLAGAQLQSAVDAHDLQLAVLDGLPATGRHGGHRGGAGVAVALLVVLLFGATPEVGAATEAGDVQNDHTFQGWRDIDLKQQGPRNGRKMTQ